MKADIRAARPRKPMSAKCQLADSSNDRPCLDLSGEHFVFFEPIDHPVPAILGRFLAVAWPIVGVKAVRRAGVDVKLGRLAGGLELILHCLDLLDLDAGIVSAIETKHWFLHLAGKVERVLRHGI